MGNSDYGDLSSLEFADQRNIRRIERLQNSLSYRIGRIITDSFRRPWRLFIMPFLLIDLAKNYVFERLGKRNTSEKTQNSLNDRTPRDCVILFPTNGVGLGHFSRMISLARSIKRKSPTTEVVFFTTNYVLHPLYSMGFTSYHLPGRKKFRKMKPSTWNTTCEEMLSGVFALHRPSVFVFDGAYPYRGMLNSIKNQNSIHKAWVRRLGDPSKDSSPDDAVSHFDMIVIPGDFIDIEEGLISNWDVPEVSITPPLISVSRSDLSPRGALRRRIGIPQDSEVCLLSLGAGVVNDVSNIRRFVVDFLTERGIYVIVAESMLNPTRETFDNNLVRLVEEFPIMRFRNCFDFAVIAAGYNSIHESILLKLPALVIPNASTGSDDQESRAYSAAEKGGFIVVDNNDIEMLDLALDRISDSSVRDQMIESLGSNQKLINGSKYLADSLLDKIG